MRKYNYISTLALTNTSGIGIIEIDHLMDTYVKYQLFNGNNVSRIGTVKVRYDKDGKPYVMIHRNRYYMSQFIRTNVGPGR